MYFIFQILILVPFLLTCHILHIINILQDNGMIDSELNQIFQS